MNHETELKLQAYLDGELPAQEAQPLADWLARDDQARTLYDELRATKSLLSDNELERSIPESREFYWSKIERAILAQEKSDEHVAAGPYQSWWLRFIAPLAAAILLVTVLLVALKSGNASRMASYFHEVDTPIEEASGITFHSEAAGMTVVWIQSQEN